MFDAHFELDIRNMPSLLKGLLAEILTATLLIPYINNLYETSILWHFELNYSVFIYKKTRYNH